MAQNSWTIPLMAAPGKAEAIARLKQEGKTITAKITPHGGTLPPDATVWLLTTAGPVPLEMGAAPNSLLGAALMQGGRCLCIGVIHGVRADLEKEKVRLRMAGMDRIAKTARPVVKKEEYDKTHGGAGPREAAPMPGTSEKQPTAASNTEPVKAPILQEPLLPPQETENIFNREDLPVPPVAKEKNTIRVEPPVPQKEQARAAAPLVEPIEPLLTPEPIRRPRFEPAPCPVSPIISGEEPTRHMPCTDLSRFVPKGAAVISGQEPPVAPPPMDRIPGYVEPIVKKPERPAPPTRNFSTAQPKPIGNSEALSEILARAEALFPDQGREEQKTSVVAPIHNRPSPFATQAAQWDAEVDAMLTAPANPPEPRSPWMPISPGLPAQTARPVENPFPNTFPRSDWRKVFRPQGQGWYLEGHMKRDQDTFFITAVPGEYRPVPPRHLQGFTRYIKSKEGGFWVRVARRR